MAYIIEVYDDKKDAEVNMNKEKAHEYEDDVTQNAVAQIENAAAQIADKRQLIATLTKQLSNALKEPQAIEYDDEEEEDEEELKFLPLYKADAKTLLHALERYEDSMAEIRGRSNPDDERTTFAYYFASDEITGAGLLMQSIQDLYPDIDADA